MANLRIYTDGSCLYPKGPGGWAYIILGSALDPIDLRESGRSPSATNNQMELQAVIEAFRALLTPAVGLQRLDAVTVLSDSEYVIRGMREWLPLWKAKNWIRSDRKPVMNQELWRRLDGLSVEVTQRTGDRIEWEWVKGHSGDGYNGIVDSMAYRAAAEAGTPPNTTPLVSVIQLDPKEGTTTVGLLREFLKTVDDTKRIYYRIGEPGNPMDEDVPF